MRTLLVNQKMAPALAARIEASVAGRRQVVGLKRSNRRVALVVRAAAVVMVLGVVGSAVWAQRNARLDRDRMRAALTQDWSDARNEVGVQGEQLLMQIERLLTEAAGHAGAGEYVAQPLRREGALAAVLARPLIYVRIPSVAAATHASIAAASAESGKDAFLLCLLEPPRPASEQAFLPKARAALAGGTATYPLTAQVFRLHDLESGTSRLSLAWGAAIAGARDTKALSRLQRDFQKAPILGVKNALRAEVLVATLDEADDSGGVTEMDGEHPHTVRVVLWDLKRAELLLSVRRHVDPSWVSPNRRSQYARELDSCKLAIAVHDTVTTELER